MIKSLMYKDIKVGTKLGMIEVDKEGIVITKLSEEFKAHLLTMPNVFCEIPDPIVEEEEEGATMEIELSVFNELELDLQGMTVAELKKLAKEKDIKLSATKKADIIEEILAEM